MPPARSIACSAARRSEVSLPKLTVGTPSFSTAESISAKVFCTPGATPRGSRLSPFTGSCPRKSAAHEATSMSCPLTSVAIALSSRRPASCLFTPPSQFLTASAFSVRCAVSASTLTTSCARRLASAASKPMSVKALPSDSSCGAIDRTRLLCSQ